MHCQTYSNIPVVHGYPDIGLSSTGDLNVLILQINSDEEITAQNTYHNFTQSGCSCLSSQWPFDTMPY